MHSFLRLSSSHSPGAKDIRLSAQMQLNKSNGTQNVFCKIANSGICAVHMK